MTNIIGSSKDFRGNGMNLLRGGSCIGVRIIGRITLIEGKIFNFTIVLIFFLHKNKDSTKKSVQ